MDAFTYHDIFQTKGIEYIIIITFLVLLIPFWVYLSKKPRWMSNLQQSVGHLVDSVWQVSKGVYYNKNHTWAHLEKSGLAQVGPDNWLMRIVGSSSFIPQKEVGFEIKKGDVLAHIRQDDKTLRIYSPITGIIRQMNQQVFDGSGNTSADPWLFKIEPRQWKAETQQSYLGDESEKWFKKELGRFKDFVAVSSSQNSPDVAMVVLQEGGELMENPMAGLPAAVWSDFQKEFLNL